MTSRATSWPGSCAPPCRQPTCPIRGKWLEDNGIRHIRGRPYHPMTQGKIERYHRSMKNRILLDNYYLPGQLEQSIEEFVSYYNKRKTIEQRRRLHQLAIAA